MPTTIVAVYGTLREGLKNHTLISECKRIGHGWLTGFRMYNLGEFPGIIFTHDDSGRIRIEWYEISEETLEELDVFENYQPDSVATSQHTRKRVFSPYGPGWIYLYNQPLNNAPYMEAGDWERFTREKKELEEKEANKHKELRQYGPAVSA